ncbi:DNA damage-inducible protein 1-like protein [Tanacetum coccineum]
MNHTTLQQECAMKLEPPQETPKLETFSKKVKRHIMENQANKEKLLKKLECEPVNTTLVNDIQKTPEYTRHLQELVSNKIQIEKLSMVKLNAKCSVVLQNELPPKEKDPGSFLLPCIIGNTTVSNALADLGSSISVMPFSLFKRLGLWNPRPVNMVIEMADRSMQSPKGIVENVLVKIHKFIFLVDFVILDIVEDNKVPVILGRPMLATAHPIIDVFGGKISLEIGKEQVIFNANEGATPITVSPVCVTKNFDVIDDIDGPGDLKEFLMNDNLNGDLGNFLQDNNLFLNYETNSPFPDKSSREIWSPTKGFQDSDNDFGGRIDELVAIDNLLGDQDPEALNNKQPLKLEFHSIGNRVNRYNHYNLQITCKIGFVNFNPYIDPISPFNIMSRVAYNSIMKRELTYTGNNILRKAKNLQVVIGCHSFLTNFIILENMNEFVEKWVTEVILGKPFKEKIRLDEDISKGRIWFKIRDDKTIFNMPRAERRLSKLTTEQQNMMSPILKFSDEDKAKGISHLYQQIKEFYKGCLNLGEEYKQDLEVIDWIKRGHASVHGLT